MIGIDRPQAPDGPGMPNLDRPQPVDGMVGAAALLEARLHRDRCILWRTPVREDGDGITRPGEPVAVHPQEIPCKLSRRRLEEPVSDGRLSQVAYGYTVHLHPRYTVEEGDTLQLKTAAGEELWLRVGGSYLSPLSRTVTAHREEIA